MTNDEKISTIRSSLDRVKRALRIQERNLAILRGVSTTEGIPMLDPMCDNDRVIMETMDDVGLQAGTLAEECVESGDKDTLDKVKPMIAEVASVRRECLSARVTLKELNRKLSNTMN